MCSVETNHCIFPLIINGTIIHGERYDSEEPCLDSPGREVSF